ncbi:MAG: type II secretion system GspH family protein [Verrucomicrobia bacterium]|nr:type II secretion system GspH family protein [Verrucomicrobiota bacterium]
MLRFKKGFSLLEMLAVLMVMAVLAAMVMPAIGHLRSEAGRLR